MSKTLDISTAKAGNAERASKKEPIVKMDLSYCYNELVKAGKCNKENIDKMLKEYREKCVERLDRLYVYEYDLPDMVDEYYLYHDTQLDEYYIASPSGGLQILKCPANINDIDMDRIEAAMNCYYNILETNNYHYVTLCYNQLEDKIEEIINEHQM